MRRYAKKMCFVLDWGQWKQSTVVFSGMDKKELLSFFRKHKYQNGFIQWFEKEYDEEVGKIQNSSQGMACLTDEPWKVPFIWLRSIKDEWITYETILHEVVHAVDHAAKANGWRDEKEAVAYCIEDLFRQIRMGIDRVHGSKKHKK